MVAVVAGALPRRGCDPRILTRVCWSVGEWAVERARRRSCTASIRAGMDAKDCEERTGAMTVCSSGEGSRSVSRTWSCWSRGSEEIDMMLF